VSAPVTEFQLAPAYLQQVLTILQRLLPDCEVWAFGSRVNGTARPASDLDLVVRQPADLQQPCAALATVRAAFSVDLLDWARIPPQFRREITRNYVVLHAPAQSSRSRPASGA
jgi:uncharacterized protein